MGVKESIITTQPFVLVTGELRKTERRLLAFV
jgi:hypothetical protein